MPLRVSRAARNSARVVGRHTSTSCAGWRSRSRGASTSLTRCGSTLTRRPAWGSSTTGTTSRTSALSQTSGSCFTSIPTRTCSPSRTPCSSTTSRSISWGEFVREVGFTKVDYEERYDVALTFAGEDRSYAEHLRDELEDQGHAVFYDMAEQHLILGQDVEAYVGPIYASGSRFVVAVLGEMYGRKRWTLFEADQYRTGWQTRGGNPHMGEGDGAGAVRSDAGAGQASSSTRPETCSGRRGSARRLSRSVTYLPPSGRRPRSTRLDRMWSPRASPVSRAVRPPCPTCSTMLERFGTEGSEYDAATGSRSPRRRAARHVFVSLVNAASSGPSTRTASPSTSVCLPASTAPPNGWLSPSPRRPPDARGGRTRGAHRLAGVALPRRGHPAVLHDGEVAAGRAIRSPRRPPERTGVGPDRPALREAGSHRRRGVGEHGCEGGGQSRDPGVEQLLDGVEPEPLHGEGGRLMVPARSAQFGQQPVDAGRVVVVDVREADHVEHARVELGGDPERSVVEAAWSTVDEHGPRLVAPLHQEGVAVPGIEEPEPQHQLLVTATASRAARRPVRGPGRRAGARGRWRSSKVSA